jgi:hypothetical protein
LRYRACCADPRFYIFDLSRFVTEGAFGIWEALSSENFQGRELVYAIHLMRFDVLLLMHRGGSRSNHIKGAQVEALCERDTCQRRCMPTSAAALMGIVGFKSTPQRLACLIVTLKSFKSA